MSIESAKLKKYAALFLTSIAATASLHWLRLALFPVASTVTTIAYILMFALLVSAGVALAEAFRLLFLDDETEEVHPIPEEVDDGFDPA